MLHCLTLPSRPLFKFPGVDNHLHDSPTCHTRELVGKRARRFAPFFERLRQPIVVEISMLLIFALQQPWDHERHGHLSRRVSSLKSARQMRRAMREFHPPGVPCGAVDPDQVVAPCPCDVARGRSLRCAVFKATLGGDGLRGLEPRSGVRDDADPRGSDPLQPRSGRRRRSAVCAADDPGMAHRCWSAKRSGGSNTCESHEKMTGAIGISVPT